MASSARKITVEELVELHESRSAHEGIAKKAQAAIRESQKKLEAECWHPAGYSISKLEDEAPIRGYGLTMDTYCNTYCSLCRQKIKSVLVG